MRIQLRMKLALMALFISSSQIAQAVDLFAVQFTSGSSAQATNYDLTTAGGSSTESVIDWAVWGEGTDNSLTPTNRKTGGNAISALTNIDPNSTQIPLRALGQYGGFGSFQWTDGSPTLSGSNIETGIQHNVNVTNASETQNVGFSFDVIGSSSEARYVYFWLGVYSGNSTVTATLNGATPLTFNLTANQSVGEFGLLKIRFQPTTSTDLLTISGVVNGTVYDDGSGTYYSNTWFNGAMVTAAVPVPEPSTNALGLIASGTLAWIARCRKARRA